MGLSEIERRVCAMIAPRRDQLIEELSAQVAIATGHNHKPGLDRYRALLAGKLRAMGASLEEVPGTPRPAWLEPHAKSDGAAKVPPPVLIARRPGRKGGKRLLIAGHLDTVHDPNGSFRALARASDGKTAIGP